MRDSRWNNFMERFRSDNYGDVTDGNGKKRFAITKTSFYAVIFTIIIVTILVCIGIVIRNKNKQDDVSSVAIKPNVIRVDVEDKTGEDATSDPVPSATQQPTQSPTESPKPKATEAVVTVQPNVNNNHDAVNNIVNKLITDMTCDHESLIKGAIDPTTSDYYDWARRPVIVAGNVAPDNMSCFMPWGMVYPAKDTQIQPNTRVEIRDLEAYMLCQSNSQWVKISKTGVVDGKNYIADFVSNATTDVDWQKDVNGSALVSLKDGYTFHFWCNDGNMQINPKDISAICVKADARLVVRDTSQPDDRGNARYLMDVGGDYWVADTTDWDNGKNNKRVAYGRFSYLSNDWKTYTMCTIGNEAYREILTKNPPPISVK